MEIVLKKYWVRQGRRILPFVTFFLVNVYTHGKSLICYTYALKAKIGFLFKLKNQKVASGARQQNLEAFHDKVANKPAILYLKHKLCTI